MYASRLPSGLVICKYINIDRVSETNIDVSDN